MDSSFDDFFRSAANRRTVGQALPEGSVVRFDLHDDGSAGSWMLLRTNAGVDLVVDPGLRADCHVRCSGADFWALVDGTLDPREGYLSGRLVVTGDVGIVLDLRRAVLEP